MSSSALMMWFCESHARQAAAHAGRGIAPTFSNLKLSDIAVLRTFPRCPPTLELLATPIAGRLAFTMAQGTGTVCPDHQGSRPIARIDGAAVRPGPIIGRRCSAEAAI